MVNIFKRALRRAKIDLLYSQGFHPNPKIVFEDTLPLGMESFAERMIITLQTPLKPATIVRRLRDELPAGLSVEACEAYTRRKDLVAEAAYRIELVDARFPRQPLEALAREPQFMIERQNRKGRLKKIDLKAMLKFVERVRPDTLDLRLEHRPETLVRPADVLRHLFQFPPAVIRSARVTKLSMLYRPVRIPLEKSKPAATSG